MKYGKWYKTSKKDQSKHKIEIGKRKKKKKKESANNEKGKKKEWPKDKIAKSKHE